MVKISKILSQFLNYINSIYRTENALFANRNNKKIDVSI